MFKSFTLKVIIAVLFFLSTIKPAVSQTIDQGKYLSIDQVINHLENKYSVQFFYKPEWFDKRNFQPSILELSFGEALERIQITSELSVITIDSVLYVFIPIKPIIKPPAPQASSD